MEKSADYCWGVRALYTKINRLAASTKVCLSVTFGVL